MFRCRIHALLLFSSLFHYPHPVSEKALSTKSPKEKRGVLRAKLDARWCTRPDISTDRHAPRGRVSLQRWLTQKKVPCRQAKPSLCLAGASNLPDSNYAYSPARRSRISGPPDSSATCVFCCCYCFRCCIYAVASFSSCGGSLVSAPGFASLVLCF